MNMTFSIDEIKAIQAGNIPKDLQARIDAAEQNESVKTARTAIIDTVKSNTAEFIADQLEPLDIPPGVKSIELIYDFKKDAQAMRVFTTGVKYVMSDDKAVSDDVVALVKKAVSEAGNKPANNKPQNFITSVLGDSIIQTALTYDAFNTSVKPAIDALYTNEEAQSLIDDVDKATIPGDDKLRVKVIYSSEIDAEGDKKAGWLAPNVSCSKTGAVTGGGGGTRAKRTPAPDGYKSWKEFLEAKTDDISKAAMKWAVEKYGTDYTKHISPTGLLRKFKHPMIIDADSKNEARQNRS